MNPVRSVALLLALAASVASAQTPTYFSVTAGAHPHDVAATREPGGPVYYTAQTTGKLGILDPATGKVDEVPLGRNSAPHGVVVGPDGAPWITDGGQNAIVRVDPKTHAVKRVEAAGVGAERQPEHADVRSPGQRRGLPGKAATTAASIPRRGDVRRSGARRGAPDRTASRRRRPATSTTHRSPAATSPASTSRRAKRP